MLTAARRIPGVLLLAVIAGAVPGAVAGAYLASNSRDASPRPAPLPPVIATTHVVVEQPSATTGQTAAEPTSPPVIHFTGPSVSAALLQAFRDALDRGVAEAERVGGDGGRAGAAIWVEGWPEPVVVGDNDQMRLWSTAKPPTALAVMAAANAAGKRPVDGFQRWMSAAFERSENCPEREMVLYLQALNRNVPRDAAHQFRQVLARAGIDDAHVPGGVYPPDGTSCLTAAGRLGPLLYPLTTNALQLGTATWTVRDAVYFAHALATGVYGTDGERVLVLMRKPKARSRELLRASDFTAPIGWGAGDVFKGWQPAYKPGWGGHNRGDFVIEQYVVLNVRGHRIAIAAAYHPRQQPTVDDPGQGDAWLALEDIFRPLRAAIEHEYPGR